MNDHAKPLNVIDAAVSTLAPDVVMIEGDVVGEGFRVDLTCPDAFVRLADRTGTVYRARSTWADFETASGRSVSHPGDKVVVDQLCVLAAGAAHFLTGIDPAFERLLGRNRELETAKEAEWQAK